MAQQKCVGGKNEDLSIIRTNDRGFTPSIFVNKSNALQYKCGICKQISYDAVELLCNYCNPNEHTIYCQICLQIHLSFNNNTCPINISHSNASHNANNFVRKQINNQIVRCPYSQEINYDDDNKNDFVEGNHGMIMDTKKQNHCIWTGKLYVLSNHLLHCNKRNKNNVKIDAKCNYSAKEKYEIYDAINLLTQRVNSLQSMVDTLQKTSVNQQSTITSLKSENKKLRQEIYQLKGQNNVANGPNVQYFHPEKCEKYHPMPLTIVLRHQCKIKWKHSKKLKVVLSHTGNVKWVHTKQWTKYDVRRHGLIQEGRTRWTCCNKIDKFAKGCKAQWSCCDRDVFNEQGQKFNNGCSDHETICLFCSKTKYTKGCLGVYECCNGDVNSLGCSDQSYYQCCNHSKNNDGCSMRHKCCKKPYPDTQGCQVKT